MRAHTAAWIGAAGAIVSLVGLCFLPAAFGAHGDPAMLGAGGGILSFGLLLISCAIYARARTLLAAPIDAPSSPAEKLRNCDVCERYAPVIQCRVHLLHLCGDCVAAHYDFHTCAYVPSTRGKQRPRKRATAAGS